MSPPDSTEKPLAIVLSGGGARAAYQVGVLAAIAERWPGLEVPILTGVSAGAINAAFLAAHRGPLTATIRALQGEWLRLFAEQVYRIPPRSLLRAATQWTSRTLFSRHAGPPSIHGLVDTEPLARFLVRCVDFDGIRAKVAAGTLRALALTATSYTTGRTVTFVDGAPGLSLWARAQRFSVRAAIGIRHVMASSALPIVFPAIKMEDGFYGDGSVRQTAPLAPAIHLGARRILVIAMRTTRPEARPAEAAEYPSAAEVMGLLLHSIFLDSIEADAERLERINKLLRSLPADVPPPDGLRPIDLLILRPSRDLGAMARGYSMRLPGLVKWVVRAIGGQRAGASDFLSYLLFDPEYTGHVIDLGYEDARKDMDRIDRFLVGEGG